jgi:hypothetical protein
VSYGGLLQQKHRGKKYGATIALGPNNHLQQVGAEPWVQEGTQLGLPDINQK